MAMLRAFLWLGGVEHIWSIWLPVTIEAPWPAGREVANP